MIHTKNIKFNRYGTEFEAIVTWDDQPWKNLTNSAGCFISKAFWKAKLIHPKVIHIEKHRIHAYNGGFSKMAMSTCNKHFVLIEDDTKELEYNLEVSNIYTLVIEKILYHYSLASSDKIEKMIVHIPHSLTHVPKTFEVSDGVILEAEYQRMTDWFTHELFDLDDAEKLVFPYSRLYCDVERFRADRDEPMAKKGMGVCYTSTSYGTKLRDVVGKEKTFIKSTIYDAHHKKLEKLVAEELSKDECALIVDCHSFPNEILAQHNQGDARPDICIGTDSFHTPDALLANVCDYFEKEGFAVAINEPFSGTMVPLKYYKKNIRVQSIMIEVNRKLYLNENFEKNDNFHKMKELIHNLLKNLNEVHQLNHFQ